MASMTSLLLVLAGASVFGFYRSDRPEAAAATTTEVPAVLGLGRVGVESLLRNADLVPQFRFVHGTEGASVDTAIRQSPVGGELTGINSTVTVVINIGPRLDASQPHLVARDVAYRPTWQPSVTGGGPSESSNGSGASYRSRPQQGESSHKAEESGHGEGGKEKAEKSGKGKEDH
jgi:hypothetical protein